MFFHWFDGQDWEVPDLQLTTTKVQWSGQSEVDVPVIDHPDARVLREIDKGGRLRMEDYHFCETSHCMAGGLVHICGEQGYRLATRVGSHGTAARLIYSVARPGQPCPSFSSRGSSYTGTRAQWDALNLDLLRERAAADPLPSEVA
jgi:hypothetical protein